MSRELYVREEKEERSFSIGTRTAISRNSVNRFQLEESGETRNDIYKISASQRVSSPPSLLLDSGNLMNPRERLDVPSTRRNFDLYGGSLWRIVSIAGQVRENSSSRGIWKVWFVNVARKQSGNYFWIINSNRWMKNSRNFMKSFVPCLFVHNLYKYFVIVFEIGRRHHFLIENYGKKEDFYSYKFNNHAWRLIDGEEKGSIN